VSGEEGAGSVSVEWRAAVEAYLKSPEGLSAPSLVAARLMVFPYEAVGYRPQSPEDVHSARVITQEQMQRSGDLAVGPTKIEAILPAYISKVPASWLKTKEGKAVHPAWVQGMDTHLKKKPAPAALAKRLLFSVQKNLGKNPGAEHVLNAIEERRAAFEAEESTG
jgi:hypothetical protein